ncbi:MAG: hypothetical protein IT450_06145 [Phycisphaerales bacterium]|nr:hypothetical protein [Phycisphaerales bacterium]
MADDGKRADAAAEPGKKARKGPPKTVILIAIISIVEAGLFFGAMKMFGGGPQVAHAGEEAGGENVLHGEDPAHTKAETVEMELLTKFRVPNDRSGWLYIYDLDLYVKAPKANEEKITAMIEGRKGELSDRVARIIRGNDAAVLSEPDLKTLRTQIRNAIGEMAHDPELVTEVLIPRCVPMRSS